MELAWSVAHLIVSVNPSPYQMLIPLGLVHQGRALGDNALSPSP